MRRLLVVLVVLTVAAAVGGTVSLAAPGLMQRIGFARASSAVVPPVPVPVLRALAADAPVPSAQGLAATLDGPADAMEGTFTGIVADSASGTELWSRDPATALVPGSTGKILTAAAALLTLNPTDSLITKVVAGPDPSTVVLVGGGDPTLSALKDGTRSVYPGAPTIDQLAAKVKETTQGRRISTVLVDTSRYAGPRMASGWLPEDVPGGYVAPIQALMVDGGRVDPAEQDGTRETEPAQVAGKALADALGAGTVGTGTATPGAETLAAVGSAPISELVEHLMRSSDNVLAEVLAREVAIARQGEPSFAGAVKETRAALAQAGFDPSGAEMSDGSGLSTEDRVPAKLLGQLMSAAAAPAQGPRDTEFLRPILTGLPVAGGDGTLGDRYASGSAAAPGRGVVRAKTGTLTGVTSLAGVVTDKDGSLLVFAFMSNGQSPATARPELDAMAASLSGCGCR